MINKHQPKQNVQIDVIVNDLKNITDDCKAEQIINESSTSTERNALMINNEIKISQIKTNVVGADPSKPKKLKAKYLRTQRKLEKERKQLEQNPDLSTMDITQLPSQSSKNIEHTLKSLIDTQPSDGKHKLKVSKNVICLFFLFIVLHRTHLHYFTIVFSSPR